MYILNLITPKATAEDEHYINKPASVLMLNLGQTLAAQQSVTKFIALIVMNSATRCCLA
jgi:hypothetical protein